jgi:tetratricopeptide (TPR) repeat protein
LIALRGLSFHERTIDQIPETELLRIDICWAVAAGLGVVDLIRGADFQSLHLLLALRAGEISRVARAMAFEVSQVAARGGGAAQDRVKALIEKTEALAARAGNAHAKGLAIWARGLSSYLMGDWKEAADYCERASEILRDQCTGVTWELTIANRFMLTSLLYQGDIIEISRRVPQLLSAALEQGNLFAATDLRTRLNVIWLAADDPTRARDEVIAAMSTWPRKGFHLQHYSSLVALAQIEMYTGDYEVAWRHIEGQIKALEKSMLLRIQGLRIDSLHLRARLALAGAMGNQREHHLRLAERLAKKIEGEEMAYAYPFATLVRAGIIHQRGNQAGAIALLEKASSDFDAVRMRLYAVAARRRLGELVGGDRGRQLIAQTEEWMKKQQIKNPSRMMNLLAPGF